MNVIWLKIHERMGKKVIALCDEDLLGKVYEGEKAFVDLKTYENFYKGRLVSKEEAVKIIQLLKDEFHSVNAFGGEATSAVVLAGLCEEKDVKLVAKLLHIQVYKF